MKYSALRGEGMAPIAGVRFERAGRVHYCVAEPDLAVGDAVVVEMPGGQERGWVVIAPHQVVVAELPEPPQAVARRAERAALGGRVPSRPAPEGGARPSEAAIEGIGLLGLPVDPAHVPPPAPGRGLCARVLAGLSAANREYLERKERLPRLGERVQTSSGPGRVIEVRVLRELVTVELEDGTQVRLVGPHLEPADDAAWNDRAPGRRGRRSR